MNIMKERSRSDNSASFHGKEFIVDSGETEYEDILWGEFQDASTVDGVEQSAVPSQLEDQELHDISSRGLQEGELSQLCSSEEQSSEMQLVKAVDTNELSNKVKNQVQIIATDLSTWTGTITQSITCCVDSNPAASLISSSTKTSGNSNNNNSIVASDNKNGGGSTSSRKSNSTNSRSEIEHSSSAMMDIFQHNHESMVDELSIYSTVSPLSSTNSASSFEKSFFGNDGKSSELPQCETFSTCTSTSTTSMRADDELTVKASNVQISRSPPPLTDITTKNQRPVGHKDQVKQTIPTKKSSSSIVKSPLRSTKSSQKSTPKRSGKFSRMNTNAAKSEAHSKAIVKELLSDEEQGLLDPPTPSSVQAQAPFNCSNADSSITESSCADEIPLPPPPRLSRLQINNVEVATDTPSVSIEKLKKQRNVYRKQSNKIKKIINKTKTFHGEDMSRSIKTGYDNIASLALSSAVTNDDVSKWTHGTTSTPFFSNKKLLPKQLEENASHFKDQRSMKKKDKMQLLHENILMGVPKTVKDDLSLFRTSSNISASSNASDNSNNSQGSGGSGPFGKKIFSKRVGLQGGNSTFTSTKNITVSGGGFVGHGMNSNALTSVATNHRRAQSYDDVNVHLSNHIRDKEPMSQTLCEVPRTPLKSRSSKVARMTHDTTKGSGMVDITNSPSVNDSNRRLTLSSVSSNNNTRLDNNTNRSPIKISNNNRSPKKSSSRKKSHSKKKSSARLMKTKDDAILDDSIRGRLDGFDVLSLGQARNISYIGPKHKRFAGQRYTLRSMVSDTLWASGGREPSEIILEGFSRFGEDRWAVTLDQNTLYRSNMMQRFYNESRNKSTNENCSHPTSLTWGKDNPPPLADSPRSRKSMDIHAATLSCPVDIDDEIFVIQNDGQLKSAFDLAVAPLKNADFKVSIELFQKILKGLLVRYSKSNGRHYLIGATHHSLGVLKMWEGKFEESIECFQGAIAVRTAILSLYHPSVAVSYSKMGLVYFALEQLDKALECFQKALDIRNKILKRDQLEVAKLCNNMGCVYYQKGDKLTALNLFTDALQIQRRFFQPIKRESLIYDTSITLCNMGKIYVEENDFDMSFFVFEEALMLQTQSFKRNHNAILTSMGNIAFVKAKKGEARNALQLYQSIHRAQVNKYGKLSDQATETNGLMSLIYIQQRQFDSAEACLLDVLQWQQDNLDQHHIARKNTEMTIEKCRQAQYEMNFGH